MAEKKSKKRLYCSGCNKEHIENYFYISYNPLYENRNRRMPFCKNFIQKECSNDDGSPNVEKLKEILRQLDAPFLYQYWEVALLSTRKTIGGYFTKLSMKQNRGLKWEHSIFEEDIKPEDDCNSMEIKNENETILLNEDLRVKWGNTFNSEEIELLEQTYKELSADKNLKYNSSKQYLKLATIYYVRSLSAVNSGNVTEVEKYTRMFNETMKMGEFTPSALAKNSNLEKLGSFCDFSLMVEECLDVIDIQKILPEYTQQPRDIPDKVIWYMVNYMQDSLGYERSTYEDIYSFYEKMEEDFLKELDNVTSKNSSDES